LNRSISPKAVEAIRAPALAERRNRRRSQNSRAILLVNFGRGANLLMTIFGHAVSVTYLLQFVTSAVILGLYALSESMQQQKAKLQSDRNMVFLAAFLCHHHPTITDVAKLGELTWGDRARISVTWEFFARSTEDFAKSGALPELDPAAKTSLIGHFGSILYVSVFAIPSSIGMLTGTSREVYQLIHTAVRKNLVSRMMVVLSANVFVGFILAELLLPRHPVLCAVLLVSPFFAILMGLVVFSNAAKDQQAWKEFWTNRLLEIMALAARDDNHDLFNRALFMKNDVESQPDLPIPGKLSLYTTVYSVVQVAILFFSRTLHLT
jgi:hypothetical protein